MLTLLAFAGCGLVFREDVTPLAVPTTVSGAAPRGPLLSPQTSTPAGLLITIPGAPSVTVPTTLIAPTTTIAIDPEVLSPYCRAVYDLFEVAQRLDVSLAVMALTPLEVRDGLLTLAGTIDAVRKNGRSDLATDLRSFASAARSAATTVGQTRTNQEAQATYFQFSNDVKDETLSLGRQINEGCPYFGGD